MKGSLIVVQMELHGVNGQCIEVCQNCKYNDCNYGSSNLGDFIGKPFDGKERNNLKD